MMSLIIFFVICTLFELSKGTGTFRFASHYADHMVLQRAPKQAAIWGFGEEGSHVTLKIAAQTYYIHTQKDWRGLNIWMVNLDPYFAGGPYTIKATSVEGNHMKTISLNDVYFGDVWLCGGQSNMVFTVSMSLSASSEEEIAGFYPLIRLFTVQRYDTNVTMPEIPNDKILQQWSVASKESVGGPAWQYFSSVCWMYGRRLFEKYQIPIGLISSNYGGTCVEAWSSPQDLAKCGNGKQQIPPPLDSTFNSFTNPNANSALWNGMIYPLLNTTIYGAIWYQGEQNTIYRTQYYNCSFPAMIEGWRRDWLAGTGGGTDMNFPFGFVQLASVSKKDDNSPNTPEIRWKQTAEYGYVPNKKQNNVFMAVTYDLPDSGSPYGSIHPRDKETVAERLFLGAQSIAYGEHQVYWTGPVFDSVARSDKGIQVSFRSVGNDDLILKSEYGFEVRVQGAKNWTPVMIHSYKGNTVYIVTTLALNVTHIRYNWNQDPCLYKHCAIYSSENELPAGPFIAEF